MNYKIADAVFSVSLPETLRQIWKPFLTEEEACLRAEWFCSFGECYGLDVLRMEGMRHALKENGSVLLANADWTEGRIYGQEDSELSALLEMQLYSYLLTRKTLLFHSSLVDRNGKGVMFLGPSGIGKTTQAELWAKYQGAKILNGDLTFVREDTDGFYGYGSPWHGSSPYYENARVKLCALVILHKGQDNVLTRADDFAGMQGIMEQVFLPVWYREAMDGALNTLDRLLTSVPLYDFTCRADEEATEIVRKTISGEEPI